MSLTERQLEKSLSTIYSFAAALHMENVLSGILGFESQAKQMKNVFCRCVCAAFETIESIAYAYLFAKTLS